MIWVKDHVQKKLPINSSMIRQKAENIINNQSPSSDKQEFDFSGSKGKFEKLKKIDIHYTTLNSKVRLHLLI